MGMRPLAHGLQMCFSQLATGLPLFIVSFSKQMISSKSHSLIFSFMHPGHQRFWRRVHFGGKVKTEWGPRGDGLGERWWGWERGIMANRETGLSKGGTRMTLHFWGWAGGRVMLPLTRTGSQKEKQDSEKENNSRLSQHLAPCVVTPIYLSPPLDMGRDPASFLSLSPEIDRSFSIAVEMNKKMNDLSWRCPAWVEMSGGGRRQSQLKGLFCLHNSTPPPPPRS